MSDLPNKLVAGPDDTDDGVAWVEDGDEPMGKPIAVTKPATQISDPHPNRRHILEEMVRRYNEHEALREEIERLQALITEMDEHAPPADETCNEPGISYSEACRRRLRDEGHSLFQETTDTGGEGHAS